MRTFVALLAACCLVALSGAGRVVREGEKYSTQYDNVDLKEILENDRLFTSYQKCIMDDGPCTNDGQLLRDAIPDALINCCAKCNDKQKDGARTVIKHLREKKHDVWVKVTGKYDPDGKYEKQYEKDMKEPECLTSTR